MKTSTKVAGFTAEGVFVKLSVPEGMDAALQGLTREVLRHQPSDIYWFAAQYFESLVRSRAGERVEAASHHEVRSSTRTRSSRAEKHRKAEAAARSSEDRGGSKGHVATTGSVAALAAASAPSWETIHSEEESKVHDTTASQQSTTITTRIESQSGTTDHSSDNVKAAPVITGRDEAAGSGKEGMTTHEVQHTDAIVTEATQHKVINVEESKSELNTSVTKHSVYSVEHEIQNAAEVTTKSDISNVSSLIGSQQMQKVLGDETAVEQKLEVDLNETHKESQEKIGRTIDLSETKESVRENPTDELQVFRNESDNVKDRPESKNLLEKNVHDELDELHKWANEDIIVTENASEIDIENEMAGNLPPHTTEDGNGRGVGRTKRASNEPLFDHFQSSVSHVSAVSEDGTHELASEETHEQTEESILKSASHDIRSENLGEGSHSVTEEKSEEMKEATLQTSKSLVQKSKSNIQVQDNGDTIEEEVIYTRMEESSRQETTVSKTWTIETTIETTADGETKVVERMILHSPLPGEEHSPESLLDLEETNNRIELSAPEPAEKNVDKINEIDIIKTELETSGEEESTDERNLEEDVTQKTEPSSLDIPSEHIITDGARRLQIEGLLNAAQDSASDDGQTNFPAEEIREFGLIDPEESMKSIGQISIALSKAEESLNMFHAQSSASEREAFEVDENGETVELREVPDNAENLAEVHRNKMSVDRAGDFGLISPEDTRRSLEQISLAIAMAEESFDKLPPDNSKSVLMQDEIDKSDTQENQGQHYQDVSGVVSHDLHSTQQHEFGLVDLEHAQKSSKHISAALEKAEETLILLHEDGLEKNDLLLEVSKSGATGSTIEEGISQELHENSKPAEQDTKKVEVDENGEEIVTQISSRMAEQGSIDDGREEAGRTPSSTNDRDIQDAALQPQLMMNLEGNSCPIEDAKLDKNSESSRNGSKEDSFSEPGGLLSNVREYGTDEDQATPRDEIESLRIDTPLDEEQSTGTKSSTGSEGNGDPINPPTVVISRTADVIELKDGEVNIVTQMEKEGLVATDSISAVTDDSDIKHSPTASAIAASDLTSVDDHTSGGEGSVVDHFHPSARVAGIAVVASTTFSSVHNVEESISDKATEILSAGLMSDDDVSHFIEKESEHTRLLLTESPGTKTDSCFDQQHEEAHATDEKKPENVVIHESRDILEDPERSGKIEVSELKQTALNSMEEECHLGSAETLESGKETSQNEEGSHNVLETLEVSAPFRFSSTGSIVDENGDFVVVPARSTKQTPVDENGKPIHSTLERRSINEINHDERSPRQGKVRLTSTGSLIGEDDAAGDHWYGSNMAVAEAALVRPVLAVPATQPAQEPCEEPPCIAIDVRDEKKKDIDIFKSVSSTSSAAGQAILAESSRVVVPTPIHEGMDVMHEMSKITSRIGQTVLVLGSEVRESEVDEKERPARTDSQDSYVISDDAIYIPLNPPGSKQPDLERIDSIASFPEMEKEPFDLEHDKLQFRTLTDVNESQDVPLILEIHASSETVSPTKSLASAQEAIEGHAFRTFPEGSNEADDVLIVECPVDSKAGITNWDSVVVTSHDQVRDRHDIEHEVQPKDFQLLDAIPAEHATSFSLDDSLHEVPSLQDEAVMEPSDVKVDSGSNEEKGDQHEEKSTSILKEQDRENENMQSSTSFGIPLELSSQIEKLKKSTDDIDSNIADKLAVTASYASEMDKDIKELTKTAKDSMASAEQTARDTAAEEDHESKQVMKDVEGATKELLATDLSSRDRKPAISYESNVVLHPAEDVEQALKSTTEAGVDVAERVKDFTADVTDSAQQVSKTASEGINLLVDSAVSTAEDASKAADIAVKKAVSSGKGTIQSFEDRAQSLVTEVVKDAHHKVSSLQEETSCLMREGKKIVGEEAAAAVGTVHSIKSDADSALGGAAEAVHSLTSDAEVVLGGAAEAVHSLKSDAESALGGAAEAGHSLTSGVESALGSAAETVHSLKSDMESALGGAAEAVHSLKSDAESALGGAAEAGYSLKSGAESALGGAAEAVHSLKSDAESALGGAAEAVHSLESDAESSLGGAAEVVHSLKSDAESALGGAVEVVHSLKSDAESALGGAVEAVDSLKSDAESALDGAAEAIDSEISRGADRLLPDDLSKDDVNEKAAPLHKAAKETESVEALTDLVSFRADESLKQQVNQLEETEINTEEVNVLSKAKARSKILRSDESTVRDSESGTASPELQRQTSESGPSKPGNKTTDSAQRSIPSIKFVEPSQQSTDASREIEDAHASGGEESEGAAAGGILTSKPQEAESVEPHVLEEIEKEVDSVVQKAFESAAKEEREMHLQLASAAQESSSIFISKVNAAKSETEEALEIANASVNEALNRAEKTIASEAEKAHSVLVSMVECQDGSGSSLTKGRDDVQEDGIQNVCTDSETGEAAICKTVRTTVKVHEFAEGIHERLRQEVSTLRLDSKETSVGTLGHDPQVRKTRLKSDITARKTQAKSESWESNLRKSEPSPRTPRSSSTPPSEGNGKKSQSFIPKPMKRATQSDSKPSEEPRRKPPLRKTKSLSEGASEDSKRRVKKMPSQGSTKRTAISAESVVEVAGETVAQEAINRAKSLAADSGEETGSESSGALSARMEVVREAEATSEGAKSELAQAAATIQDTFRGISERTQGGPVDEDGNEIPQPALGRSFQIEPVLEETAEEMKDERQGSQGSMQTSVSLDQDNTSTSDSSMSSAATKIQAGFRGYLARRHRRHSTTSTATLGDMSMSRGSSLLEDSEVQRHRMSPLLDQLPEAEHGPAKYVADMHTEGKRVGDCTRSLDSGLSSGTVRHPPVRNAMSVAPSRDMDGDLDEQVWRTLEREMAADEADSEETVEVSRRRRLSSRQYAMQLPTTSSSTASLDGLPARHSGEFHDMLVLPLHSGPGPQALPSAACSRAGFSLNGLDSSEGAAREAAGGSAGAARAAREAEDMKPPATTSTSTTANGKATGPAISHSPDQDQDQCRHRGMEGGGRLRGGTGWLPAQVDGDLVQRSAARIQAGVRGFLVRRRQHNASQAAAKIQAGFRGYRARRDMKLRRAQHAPHAPHAQQ